MYVYYKRQILKLTIFGGIEWIIQNAIIVTDLFNFLMILSVCEGLFQYLISEIYGEKLIFW